MKKPFVTTLGLVLGLGGIYLALKDVEFVPLVQIFKQLNPVVIAALFGVAIAHGLLLGYKWQTVLNAIQPQKYWHCYWSLRLGFFFNAILPAKLGEAIRVWFIHRKSKIPFSAGVGATIADRWMEFVGLLIFFYGALFFSDIKSESVNTKWITIVALLIPLPVVLVSFLPRNSSNPLVEKIFKFLHQTKQGIRSISDPFVFIRVLIQVFCGWSLHLVMLTMASNAIGMEASVPQLIIVMAAVSMAGAIPSAPSSLGTFEYAAVFVLSKIFQFSPESSLALGLIYHFIQLIPTWLIGASGYVYYHSELMPELKRLKNSKSI